MAMLRGASSARTAPRPRMDPGAYARLAFRKLQGGPVLSADARCLPHRHDANIVRWRHPIHRCAHLRPSSPVSSFPSDSLAMSRALILFGDHWRECMSSSALYVAQLSRIAAISRCETPVQRAHTIDHRMVATAAHHEQGHREELAGVGYRFVLFDEPRDTPIPDGPGPPRRAVRSAHRPGQQDERDPGGDRGEHR